MSIYKPTNCHPFATAVDITKSFMRLEKTDGVWKFAQPPGAYVTCKVESSNTQVVGYRVKLYENDRLIFSGEKVSPVSELPRFDDDPSINTGVNGSYLAIPLFQSDKWYNGEEVVNYRITDSYNAIYSTGYYSDHTSLYTNTSGLISDYILIDSKFRVHGETIEPDPEDDLNNWTYKDVLLPGGGHRRGYVPTYDTGDSLKINGGNVVTFDDTVLLSFSDGIDKMVLCVLGTGQIDGKPYLRVVENDVLVYESAPLYVKKGKYCGFYDRTIGDVTAPVWYEVFRTVDGAPVPSGSLVAEDWGMDVENDTFSWEIELYQGPEKYDDLVTLDQTTKAEYVDIDKLQRGQYDMIVASGTVLGSNAKRFHLSSDDGRHLPGYQLTSVPVLQNTFCEIYYSDNDRLSGSYQVVNFDSSLGIVYFKDNALAQSELDAYKSAHDEDAQLHARFFKYSANAADLLSNETVRACYAPEFDPTASLGVDPRSYLVPGCVVDGVELGTGDRVLWNSAYERGFYNGIWVVGSGGLAQPTRPADGDNWADYIGKVILVVGGTYLGHTVMESTATAGPYELNKNGLFFVKQTPIVIFGDSPSASYGAVDGALPFSSAEQYVKPQIVTSVMRHGDIEYEEERYSYQYQQDTLVSEVSLIPIPVVTGTTTVLMSFPADLLLAIPRQAMVAEVNDGIFVYSMTTTDSWQGHTPTPPTAPDGKSYRLLYSYNYIIDYEAEASLSPSTGVTVNVTYKRRYADLWVLCDNTQTGVKYKVRSGAYAGKIFMKDTNSAWWILDPSTYTTNVLFNSTTTTYVSPSSAISENMYLRLRSGTVTLYDDYLESSYLKILSYDNVFNCITHERLSSPLVAETNQSVSPSTPYKYDIVSCYRTSDANGFTFAPLLTPVFSLITPPIASSSFISSVSVYAPVGENWREGRWVLIPVNENEQPQDTGWFQNGTLDCRFVGLGPVEDYHITFYAKDKWGRVASTPFHLMTDGDLFSPYPGSLKATFDCSTQSVLIEYIPENEDYSDWPDCIPDGSYDVYRREYANFSIEGCPYYEGDVPHDESMWYGGWQPVAIGVTTTSIRDFNVKQGHSYQYAILPRAFSLSEMEFKYHIYPDDGTIVYDEIEQEDPHLPKNAPFFYKIGYTADTYTPYLFCVEREPDTTIPNPFAGDIFLYGGEYELGGKSYDLWRGQGISISGHGILTNRVVPFGAPHYDEIYANDGNPVYVQWSDWSIVELNAVDPNTLFSGKERCPAIKKAYKADINNIWLFKYDVEEGAQTINIAKSEFNSMGEFPRFFSGELNSESGEVSCWLGSEIAKGSRIGYVERRRRSIFAPLSTNEAAAMLADWRKIVKSDKPKLLRDRKGRSWIVQISGGSSSTMGTYPGRPTKISFSWKQIGNPSDATVIYGDGDELDKTGQSGVWKPRIIKSS